MRSGFCAQEFKWANKRDHESKHAVRLIHCLCTQRLHSDATAASHFRENIFCSVVSSSCSAWTFRTARQPLFWLTKQQHVASSSVHDASSALRTPPSGYAGIMHCIAKQLTLLIYVVKANTIVSGTDGFVMTTL